MKSVIIFLVLFFTLCYGEQELLGGWRKSTDNDRDQQCLQKSLFKIYGVQVGNDIQSQVSNFACRTQIVNGLNIKCNFALRKDIWECSYYQSFTGPSDIQVEGCRSEHDDEEDEEVVPESPTGNENEQDAEAKIDAVSRQLAEDKEKQDDQAVPESQVSSGNEDDDEDKIDAMSKQLAEDENNEEKEDQQ